MNTIQKTRHGFVSYRHLRTWLMAMPEEHLDQDAMIFNQGEYFGVTDVAKCDDGILDEGHPYLATGEGETDEDGFPKFLSPGKDL